MVKSLFDMQLQETCQLTGSNWAVWLERDETWIIRAKCHINKDKCIKLLNYLNNPSITDWINSAITENRNRTKRIQTEIGLNSKRIYIFPDQITQRAIIVGATDLTTIAQRFWRVVVYGDYSHFFLNRPSPPEITPGLGAGIPSHSPEALNQALDFVMKSIGSLGGWLAIRSGDHLEIRVYSRGIESSERRISIEANPLIRGIMQERCSRLVGKDEIEWAMVPRMGVQQEASFWAAFPLNIGRRIIGLIGLWLKELPGLDKWERANQISTDIASSVEGSIVFDDLSNHLRRMALLNDFSGTISSAVDIGQIVQRLFALIQRAFETNRIILIIHSLEGSLVHHYFMQEDTVVSQLISSLEAEKFWPLKKDETLRVNSLSTVQQYRPFYPDSSSALIVPLKYRRQVIGTLGVENARENAFTGNDENLLAIISSHLAGLLENGRLRQEAEARALNLSLIHSVVEQVIGLTDVNQVAQIAAELIAKNFAYELAGVALLDKDNDLRLVGIGGSAANIVKSFLLGQETRHRQGIVGRVVLTGQSLFVNDVTQDPIYTPLPDWEAGSEMCVPLRDGESILGVIDVESQRKNAFTPNDLLVLESLAGILASVISNTGQYQKLQTTVNQLQNTRLELQERIAAQRMAESRLVQAAKLAAVGEMAAGIAHELNNPLTTVSGFTELVLEGLSDDSPVRADLGLVLREAQRARGVIRRLLDFARQSESVRTRSDVNEIITDVLTLIQHLLHTSGVLLQTKLHEKLPWPSVDRNQIKQVVLNLIHNSMHAMPEGGILIISTAICKHDNREGVNIVIRDTGVGIPSDYVERVFEPFFTTKSKEGGTGLGLSVSYGIIIDHNGDIEVESKVGEGSTFTVWLPTEEK